MTTTAKVEEALKTMRGLASDMGKAKADRVYLEQFRKSKKALLFNQAPAFTGEGEESKRSTIPDRENYAYSHPEYLELLEGLKAAVEEEETIKWRLKGAELYVEVWRSQEASNRMVDRGHT